MPTILIVEDDQALRTVYLTILQTGGYAPDVAEDGKVALKRCSQKNYDLILLDLMMPELDGIGFLRQARLRKTAPHTKIIVFSNLSSGKDVQTALLLGAHEHILKSSMTPKDLLDMIGKLHYA